jgi:hypothetical protein
LKYYCQERKERPTYRKGRKANCIDRILRRNCLLKYVNEAKIEGKIEGTGKEEEEEEEVSSYWMTLRKREDTGS